MTRQEFIDSIEFISELVEFCADHNLYDFIEDIYDADTMNEIVMDRVSSMRSWTEVRDLVRDIPDRCGYYKEDAYGDFVSADEYFEDIKDDVLRYMDDNDCWDEEDEEVYDEDNADMAAYEEEEEDISDSGFLLAVGRSA